MSGSQTKLVAAKDKKSSNFPELCFLENVEICTKTLSDPVTPSFWTIVSGDLGILRVSL